MSFVSKIRQLFTPNAGHASQLEQMVDQYFDEYGKREAYEEFREHYPKSFSGQMEEDVESSPIDRQNVRRGRNVAWVGEAGRMVRVDPEYMQHISGNIFYPEKLASVAAAVELHPDTLYLTAPYGQMAQIDVHRVKESQEYWEDEGLDEPLSTGDDELDEYIVDPEEYLDDHADDDERQELREEMEERLQEAIDSGDGDLGSWIFTVRDGNHRAFGALAGGEPYVWAILMDSDYQDLVAAHDSGTMTEEQQELWDMLT